MEHRRFGIESRPVRQTADFILHGGNNARWIKRTVTQSKRDGKWRMVRVKCEGPESQLLALGDGKAIEPREDRCPLGVKDVEGRRYRRGISTGRYGDENIVRSRL